VGHFHYTLMAGSVSASSPGSTCGSPRPPASCSANAWAGCTSCSW
jgi:hypothetical protein